MIVFLIFTSVFAFVCVVMFVWQKFYVGRIGSESSNVHDLCGTNQVNDKGYKFSGKTLQWQIRLCNFIFQETQTEKRMDDKRANSRLVGSKVSQIANIFQGMGPGKTVDSDILVAPSRFHPGKGPPAPEPVSIDLQL